MRYIKGEAENGPLKPYSVKGPSSINDARRIIGQLLEPLVDIVQLIGYNIYLLEKQKVFFMEETDINILVKKLHIPMLTLETIKLTHPITVCIECADVVKVS